MTSSSNVVWQQRHIEREAREQRNGHQGAVLWFTGLPAAGKTTISFQLERRLFARGIQVYALDGDNIRHGLSRDLGFRAEERREHIRRVGEVAKLFMDSGQIVLSAFISPYREDRANVRALIAPAPFIEIFVDCPLAECERRDPKGHYKRARAGEIAHYTGISAPYEAPQHPELHLRTDTTSAEENVDAILAYLLQRQLIESQ